MRHKSILFFTNIVIAACCSYVAAQETYNKNFPKLTELPDTAPVKTKVWVFILAGQSNMAGRAFVEAQDTVPNPRILSINTSGKLILAKEPLHFYEPGMSGLDCGLSFARALLNKIPASVSVLLIPAAVGGSSIDQWMGDSVHRHVKLHTNLKEKIAIAKSYGTIKAILWHQGESDATAERVAAYKTKLTQWFQQCRDDVGSDKLPIITAEIGMFSQNKMNQLLINKAIMNIAASDDYTYLIQSADFSDKGDRLHFDSRSQRLMGERMAEKYFQVLKNIVNAANK